MLGALHNPEHAVTRQERVLELFPDLRERISARAGTLSGGQRQMVAVGRALMSAPKLMIVDEPSAGLSPRVSRSVFRQLDRVRKSGVAVLMVEQNTRLPLKPPTGAACSWTAAKRFRARRAHSSRTRRWALSISAHSGGRPGVPARTNAHDPVCGRRNRQRGADRARRGRAQHDL